MQDSLREWQDDLDIDEQERLVWANEGGTA